MENQTTQLDALDRIGLEAAGEEAERDAAEQAILNPQPENPVDPAIAWAAIPRIFGSLLGMAMPELKPAYSEDNCMAWGGAMAQVADKYGWDAGETMSKWAPEIALVMATIPLALPTVQAIKAAKQKREAERPAIENETVEQPPMVDGNGAPIGGNFEKPE